MAFGKLPKRFPPRPGGPPMAEADAAKRLPPPFMKKGSKKKASSVPSGGSGAGFSPTMD